MDFDPLRGHQTLRFSFAGKYEEIEEAAERFPGYTTVKPYLRTTPQPE